MNENFAIQLFEGKKVRIVWDAEQEKYYFSVTDIVQVLENYYLNLLERIWKKPKKM